MSRHSKFLLVGVLCVAIATPIYRAQLKAQQYLDNLSSGVVLEATKRLKGTIFSDSVILLVDYLPQGATGLVMKQSYQQGAERYKKLLPDTWLAQKLSELEGISHPKEKMYWGGPVAQGHTFWLSYDVDSEKMVMEGTKPDAEDVKSYTVASFAGYAGWNANQLESEIKRGDWRVYSVESSRISQWLSASNANNNN